MMTGPAGIRVRDVVRAVITDVAPAELPVVEGLAVFDDDTVVRRLRGRGRRRERLGFGWDDIATVATPVVWLAVDQAAKQLGTAAGKGASNGLSAVFRSIFRRPSPAVTLPPLTPQQRAAVRDQVLAVAASRGLSRKRAEELANAVYVKLSLPDRNDQGTSNKPVQR